MKVWIRFVTEEGLQSFERDLGSKRVRRNWNRIGPKELQGELTVLRTSRGHVEFMGLDLQESTPDGWKLILNLGWPKQYFAFVRFKRDGQWKQMYSRCRHRHCSKVEIDRRTLGHMSARALLEYKCRTCGYVFQKWEWGY
jgi:hypothetical protein